MLIGVPKEIKTHEYRVGLTATSVREIVRFGHQILIERGAGLGINIKDEDYIQAGAKIVDSAVEIFSRAELIAKVKEPQPHECKMLRENQTLFTYLHLAADKVQGRLLQESGCTAIAYETVTREDGGLPLLIPMSQVAGRMSIQAGAHALEKANGGSGVLLGGVPGVKAANVVVLGGGVVGTNALRMAVGMEANVTVIDKSLVRLNQLDSEFGAKLNTIYATQDAIERNVFTADLVIGAVLVPGAHAPRMVTRDMLKSMRPHSVIVDVSIDQGGCFETSRATTHQEPTYVEENIVHYCVANMPGGVPRTSTFALNNATLPYILELASKGVRTALDENKHFMNGLNVLRGAITHEAVAEAIGQPYTPVTKIWQ